MCPYVLAYLQNGDSQRHRILLAHAEPTMVDSEGVVVFQISIGMTLFLLIERASTRARISLQRRIGSPPNV